jgi:hypothetical protein
MRTYLVGRSAYADIVIADPSVAEHHAEIVATADGRLFVTDCATGAGTWRLAADGSWERLRQAFVAPEAVLRLGAHRCVLRELLAPLAAEEAGERGGGGGGEGERLLKGRVARDPATGELVRRRPT